jgi:outer membrane protein assembly factor BamE (lipoprotein component of BamABCDE complex)
LSPGPVSYSGLTAEDQEGIKAGKATVGMTKQGVKVALGYPAQCKTPSLDANTWVYWKSRFNTRAVNFGGDGKVESIKG